MLNKAEVNARLRDLVLGGQARQALEMARSLDLMMWVMLIDYALNSYRTGNSLCRYSRALFLPPSQSPHHARIRAVYTLTQAESEQVYHAARQGFMLPGVGTAAYQGRLICHRIHGLNLDSQGSP